MRRLIGPVVAAVLAAAVPVTAPAGAELPPAAQPTGSPVIGLPATLPTGSGLPVTVSGVTGSVTLTVLGSLGSVVRTAAATDGTARFSLEPEITRSAGTLTLVADAGGRPVTGSVVVLPGPAVGPLLPVVGSRSIAADATDRSMVVALPVDRWGNSIAEGSSVTVVHRDPAGVTTTGTATISHLLGWLELTSGTVAGRGDVWLTTGPGDAVTGQQVSLDEVAGPPVAFTLAMADPAVSTRLGADGQTLVAVRTSTLADRYGNVEPDGTLVTVEWDGPGGRSRSSAVTISGVAELSLQSPAAPGTVTLTAVSRGTRASQALVLDFPSVVTTVPVDTRSEERGLVVTVGPVDRADGTYVPDGTIATVTVADGAGRRVSGTVGLVDGTADQLLPVSAMTGPLTVTVTVLGTSATADVG